MHKFEVDIKIDEEARTATLTTPDGKTSTHPIPVGMAIQTYLHEIRESLGKLYHVAGVRISETGFVEPLLDKQEG